MENSWKCAQSFGNNLYARCGMVDVYIRLFDFSAMFSALKDENEKTCHMCRFTKHFYYVHFLYGSITISAHAV